MITQDQRDIQLMNHLSFVSNFHDALGAGRVLDVMLDQSKIEWDKCFDANTGEHLIKGKFTSSQKSDAVRIYIAAIIGIYLRSSGVRVTSWTKATITSDNTTNVSISNRIAATEFQSHEELFKLVVTRLVGVDDALVDYVLALDNKAKALCLVTSLASRFDLTDSAVTAKTEYFGAIDYVEEKLNKGGFNTRFFLNHWEQIVPYYNDAKQEDELVLDHFDLLEQFDVTAV